MFFVSHCYGFCIFLWVKKGDLLDKYFLWAFLTSLSELISLGSSHNTKTLSGLGTVFLNWFLCEINELILLLRIRFSFMHRSCFFLHILICGCWGTILWLIIWKFSGKEIQGIFVALRNWNCENLSCLRFIYVGLPLMIAFVRGELPVEGMKQNRF